MTLAKIP